MKKRSSVDAISEDDFKCGICLELIIDPTTLTCGHTMCRFCVAQWWHNSNKCTCPECQQVWHGFPQVNIHLRNTINSLFPDESKEREGALAQNPECKKMIDMFNANARGSQNGAATGSNRNWSFLFLFVAIAIGVAVVISVGVKKLTGKSQDDIMSKSIQNWSPDDVALWVGALGLWSKIYADRFIEAGIDGSLLLQMKEGDLKPPPISMTLPLHRRVFVEKLQSINQTLSAHPSGLWEYKERKSGMALFIMMGIREFPRSTLVYLYLFNYRDTFLPLFDGTFNNLKARPTVKKTTKSMKYNSWFQFILHFVFIPYYFVASFAFLFLEINYWTSRMVIMHSVLMTLAEITEARNFFRRLRNLPYLASKYMCYVCLMSLVIKLVWPFVPFFIADCLFYWCLYVSPWDALNRIRKRLFGRRQDL